MLVNGCEIRPWADLSKADLHNADLRGAILHNANLYKANLDRTNLHAAELYRAILWCANLSEADLRHANLCSANLREADLYRADLRGADLTNADLYGADLREAKLSDNFYYPLACPCEGTFIGWKKVTSIQGSVIVKLEIPAEAKRCSATTRKCRCEYAKVLGFYNFKKEEKSLDKIINFNYSRTDYIKGEYVYPDFFDEDRWNECSHGIHFFVNFEDARDY